MVVLCPRNAWALGALRSFPNGKLQGCLTYVLYKRHSSIRDARTGRATQKRAFRWGAVASLGECSTGEFGEAGEPREQGETI